MTTPSIASLIRQVIDTADTSATAADIATGVLARISPDRFAHYLHELISARVASEIGSARNSVTPARSSMSTKQSLIRDQYWPRFLQQMISLPSGYKRLADATSDDLSFIANMRRSQANDLLAKAEQFEALAALMRKSKVSVLADLDARSGEKLLAA